MTGKRREQLLLRIVDHISLIALDRPVRIAVDGRTASGKTTFANELASALEVTGRTIIRSSIDGFHRPKIERYARGRYSPQGYYHDARDLPAIMANLLEPLGPNGDLRYRTETFDLHKDKYIDQESTKAPADAILIVDGTFLQRPELDHGWDLRIFLDTSESISETRGIERDSLHSDDPAAVKTLYAERYRPAFASYEALCDPLSKADIVWSNDDLSAPQVVFSKV